MEAIRYEDMKICAALAREIKNLMRAEEFFRSSIERFTSPPRTIPEGSAHKHDKMADGIAELVDMQAEVTAKIAQFSEHVGRVEAVIASLGDSDQRNILRCRYVLGMTWEEVSEATHWSVTWSHELHDQGIKIIFAKECMEV